ncbi:MAG: GNAT family N-acetyltransferase, partial [Bilophila sp.]
DPLKKGELVAYVSVYHTPDELEILNIAVRADRRNQKYGQRLLGLVLRIAKKMGIVKAVLEVRVTNTPALCLYGFFGFVQAGVRRGYYPDTGEDALVYVLDMPQRLTD